MQESELRALVCKQFLGGDDAPIEADMDLLEAGICDSLGLVRLVAELERAVPGLKVLDQEVTRQNLGSIQAMGDFIRRKLGR
jgi:acyl carrier protein